MPDKSYYLPEIQQKIEKYCAYQERCQMEVRQKLYKLGVSSGIHEFILSDLIQKNFLNEERFAVAFASGKFRIKGWGKVLIEKRLREKQISRFCIQKALSEIDDNEYHQKLEHLANGKISRNLDDKGFKLRSIVFQYLFNKGYETDRINSVLDDLLKK